MTTQEELTYLCGILSEASKWTASADDNRDLVRMEVEERIHNLINGVEPEPDENGRIQSSVHPDNLPAEDEDLTGSEHLASPEKVEKALNSWKSKRVRCQENGKPVWHLRCECIQEPRDNRNGGPKWTWKWLGPQDKKAQEDHMWEKHEAGND